VKIESKPPGLGAGGWGFDAGYWILDVGCWMLDGSPPGSGLVVILSRVLDEGLPPKIIRMSQRDLFGGSLRETLEFPGCCFIERYED